MTSSPAPFVNAALLVRRGRGSVDFYVTSERSYTIAYRVKGWDETLRRSFDELSIELRSAAQFETTRESLRWFLRQPSNWDILCQTISGFPKFEDSASRILLVLAFCDFVEQVKAFTETEQDEAEAVTDTMNQFMPSSRLDSSPVSDLLLGVLLDSHEQLDVRRTCAIGLSSFSPQICLFGLGQALIASQDTVRRVVKEALEPAFNSAVESILDEFYGTSSMGMCPSYLDSMDNDPDALLSEYDSLHKAAQTALRYYGRSDTSQELYELLTLLNPMHRTTTPPDDLQASIPFKEPAGDRAD